MSWLRNCGILANKGFIATGSDAAQGMESTRTRNKEKKGSQLSQATTFLGGGSISAELTDEALFIAGFYKNPVPTKEKQTQDRGTQMSKHVIFTKTRGTDTCSDRNHACTKAYLLPSPHDKGALPSSLTSGG
ncbi:putative protein T-ENOL isoform 2-T2 [Glossophaga mutica]